jgi:RNA polymerase sigma-70 factor (ECF subfamily)
MLRAQERVSLQDLARAELPGLYGFARHLTRSPWEAEDLVQETLVRACRSFAALHDVQAAPKWLRVIMTNVWRDQVRKAGRVPVEVPIDDDFSLYRELVEEDPLPYSDSLHVDFLGAFSDEDIRLVLRRMPEHLRVALVLRYIEGFDTGEIATMLALPPGTVYSHLFRGRKAFERALWDYAGEVDLLAERTAAERRG